MALPPDTPNEAFLREVDDNLRRDQLEGFAKTYGKWLIAAVVIFLIAVAAYLYWQDRQQKEAAAQSEKLMAIYTDIGNGNADKAKKELQPLESADNHVVRALAQMTEAAVALDANDRDTALKKYRALSADDGLPDAYRNLALIRLTALEFDDLKPDQVISRMEPLAKPGSPWFGSAGELTAMAYLAKKQDDKAGRIFAALARDEQVPQTIRSRAVQIASTLGVQTNVDITQKAQSGSSE